MKRVGIIMGSDSDLPVVQKCADKLKELGLEYEMHIMSAHRTPGAVSEFASKAHERGFGVLIACAGMAAHLGGFIAAHTVLPVIGVPLKSAALEGMDALLATVQMPSGIPVATVAINGAANAAVLASEILALNEPELFARLVKMRESMAEAVRKKDAALQDTAQTA